jgi:hypothetical protein
LQRQWRNFINSLLGNFVVSSEMLGVTGAQALLATGWKFSLKMVCAVPILRILFIVEDYN